MQFEYFFTLVGISCHASEGGDGTAIGRRGGEESKDGVVRGERRLGYLN